MLSIKRVPTVVSNYQKEETGEAAAAGGCGRNCLKSCCIQGGFLWFWFWFFWFECVMQGFNLNIGPRSQFWLQIEDV